MLIVHSVHSICCILVHFLTLPTFIWANNDVLYNKALIKHYVNFSLSFLIESIICEQYVMLFNSSQLNIYRNKNSFYTIDSRKMNKEKKVNAQ